MDLRTVLYRPLEPGVPPAFDWELAGATLAEDDGLETAIIVSLFTDRRAAADDVLPDGTDDRRGWWADAWPEIAGDRIGSRLWLLYREKDRAAVVIRAREYADEALAWLVADGVASRVVVETGWVDRIAGALTETKTALAMPGVLGIGVTVYRPAAPVAKFRFETFWRS